MLFLLLHLVHFAVPQDSDVTTGIPAALDAIENSDVVVLVLGITSDQEHEGIDRQDTLLPGLQESFALQVCAKAKAQSKVVVVVLVNGGIVSVDALIKPAGAIVEAFNPVDHGTNNITNITTHITTNDI